MKVCYQFLETEQLLVQKVYGEWSTEHYINYVTTVFNSEKMLTVKKIITDLRAVNLEAAFKDIDFLVAMRDKMLNLNYLSVVLVNEPTATVIIHLYQEKAKKKGSAQNYCCTVNRALQLLKLKMSEKTMDALFDNLTDSF